MRGWCLLPAALAGLTWVGGGQAHPIPLDDIGCYSDVTRGGYPCHTGPLEGRTFESQVAAEQALPQDTAQAVTEEAPAPANYGAIAIQNMLTFLGYDPGPADGAPGPATENAIMAFQADNDLPVDGQMSGELLVLLSEAILSQGGGQ